ncbi:MAG: hypothetical protein KA796_02280 [Chryseobacterium sp.]|nr:hypothetical protein [Chryseobacterium sp.]MBP7498677.1 hypothetical protein [Chryseobacterium sp.]
MKINNRKEVTLKLYGFFFLLLLDLLFLILSQQFFPSSEEFYYTSFVIIFIFCMWRIIKLKIFSLEVSKHILSVKYRHPLAQNRQPVLELPLHKVIAMKTEKAVINYILSISISSRKGIKNFYYRLEQMPENQPEKYNQIAEFIKTSKKEPYHYS